MRTSESGMSLIKKYEHFTGTAYRGMNDVFRVGYNHTRGVKSGDQVTEMEADVFLRDDLKGVELEVKRLLTKKINQNQFDALVSFAFSEGIRVFKRSSVLRMINDNPGNPLIRQEFRKFIYRMNNMPICSLIRRREAEADLYEKDV